METEAPASDKVSSESKPILEMGALGPDATKWDIREKVWQYIEDNDLANFPRPVKNRIPNVKGAAEAANKLPTMEVFQKAGTIKINPDKPQEQARFLTLEANKTLLVPTPRLRTGLFNKIVPPPGCGKDILRICSTTQGIREYSVSIGLDDKVTIDLVVVGSVAVSKTGVRIGKGEGFADLEFGMMATMGAVSKDTIVITTVHDCQIVDIPEKLVEEHDITVDYIVTPTQIIECKQRPKPTGIYWHKLEPSKMYQVPILRKLRAREREAGKDVTLKEGAEEPPENEEAEDGEGRRYRGGRGRRGGRYRGNRPRREDGERPQGESEEGQDDQERGEGGRGGGRGGGGRGGRRFQRRRRPRRNTDDQEGGSADRDHEREETGNDNPDDDRRRRRRRPRQSDCSSEGGYQDQRDNEDCGSSEGGDQDHRDEEDSKENGPSDGQRRRRRPRRNRRPSSNSGEQKEGDDRTDEGEDLDAEGKPQRRRRRPNRNRRRSGNSETDPDHEGGDRQQDGGEGYRPRRRNRNRNTSSLFVGSVPRTLRVSEFKTQVKSKIQVEPQRVIWHGGKGHAFLQFKNMTEADEALQALAGLTIGERELKVEMSNNNRRRRDSERKENKDPNAQQQQEDGGKSSPQEVGGGVVKKEALPNGNDAPQMANSAGCGDGEATL